MDTPIGVRRAYPLINAMACKNVLSICDVEAGSAPMRSMRSTSVPISPASGTRIDTRKLKNLDALSAARKLP
ncbi:hypothetical protein P3T23_006064 [Paraburkholderia sp. GAS448]